MQFALLKEFFPVTEASAAPSGPIEVKDVAKYFPKNAQKAVRTLVEKDRLVYDGKDIMGELYDAILSAAKSAIDEDNGGIVMANFSHKWEDDNGKKQEFDIDEVPVEIDDVQDVYLGYYPKGDIFVMGFDAWFNEEDFWEEVEKEAKKQGVNRNDQWDEVCSKLWKQVRDNRGQHVRVEVKVKNGRADAQDVESDNGIWYSSRSGGYGSMQRTYPGILDIRLD